MREARRPERRLLSRQDCAQGPRDRGRAGGNPPRSDRQAALAQVYALGRWDVSLGAALARDRRYLRRRGRAVQDRRCRKRQRDTGTPVSFFRRNPGPPVRGLREEASHGACDHRRGRAARDHRARLSDAMFFWEQDKKRSLESRVADLKDIVFHAKLGTQLERVERIEALAGEIAKLIGADVEKAKRAARLAKADLTTGVVGEFPELQGVMGCYYALHDGEPAEVADAIRDHYKPLGQNDRIPSGPISTARALADKVEHP